MASPNPSPTPQSSHDSHGPNSEDNRGDRSSAGRRIFVASSGRSIRGSFVGSFDQLVAPAGQAFSFVTSTNSTVSGIPGPGRTVGELLSGAGRRLEPILDRMALRVISTFSDCYTLRTPNGSRFMVHRTSASVLRTSWARFASSQTGLLERSNLVRLIGVSVPQ
jgi:hypothetical protein